MIFGPDGCAAGLHHGHPLKRDCCTRYRLGRNFPRQISCRPDRAHYSRPDVAKAVVQRRAGRMRGNHSPISHSSRDTSQIFCATRGVRGS